MGRGACLPVEEGFWFIGPTITLGGGIRGAGTGMLGCVSPPDSEVKRATFLGKGEGVRTPVDSPTNLGLSSQAEAEETTIGLSENLSSTSGLETGDFSDMIKGGFAETEGRGFASILGGGRPVSF